MIMMCQMACNCGHQFVNSLSVITILIDMQILPLKMHMSAQNLWASRAEPCTHLESIKCSSDPSWLGKEYPLPNIHNAFGTSLFSNTEHQTPVQEPGVICGQAILG